jgi:hypothetical protein
MSVQELVRRLPRDTRTHLCEELIEIILNSKNGLPNELVFNILDFWKTNQLITAEKTLSLLRISFEKNPKDTKALLDKLDLSPLTEMLEVKIFNG